MRIEFIIHIPLPRIPPWAVALKHRQAQVAKLPREWQELIVAEAASGRGDSNQWFRIGKQQWGSPTQCTGIIVVYNSKSCI